MKTREQRGNFRAVDALSGTVVFDPQAVLCTLRYATKALDIARLASLHVADQADEQADADLAYDTAARLAHATAIVAGAVADWETR